MLYCPEPKKCRNIASRRAANERKLLGITATLRLPPKPRETVASQRYREAVASLAAAKHRAEAARRAIETADGVVEQAELRLRDAQATLHRERAKDEDPEPRKRKPRSPR